MSANIITRGRRSLGYGFVEFATEADAAKAAEAMNKKEISGRAINVELARPRDPTKEGEAAESKPRQPRAPRAPRAEGANAAGATANGANNRERRPRGPRRNNAAEGAAAAAPASNGAAAAASSTGAAPSGGRGPRRGPRTTGPRTSAPRRPRTEQEQRPASDTTLFVANVPFSTDDAQLLSFFADYHPKSAHVVRMRNGRSRGYGFVEFDTAAGQNAGLAVDGKDVPLPNGSTLKLSVKVAMTPPVPAANDAAAAAPVAQ